MRLTQMPKKKFKKTSRDIFREKWIIYGWRTKKEGKHQEQKHATVFPLLSTGQVPKCDPSFDAEPQEALIFACLVFFFLVLILLLTRLPSSAFGMKLSQLLSVKFSWLVCYLLHWLQPLSTFVGTSCSLCGGKPLEDCFLSFPWSRYSTYSLQLSTLLFGNLSESSPWDVLARMSKKTLTHRVVSR